MFDLVRIKTIFHQCLVGLLLVTMLAACESSLVRQVHYYEKIGDSASALAYLEAEAQRRPDDTETLYWLGKMQLKEGVFSKARTTLDQVTLKTSRYSESINYLLETAYRSEMEKGMKLLAGSKTADNLSDSTAVQHFLHASQIRPEYNEGHRLHGYALIQAGELQKAAQAYQQAVMTEPADLEAWNNLSEIAFVTGDYKAASDYAQEVLKKDPANVASQRRLAHAQVHLRENDAAAESFKKLLALKAGLQDTKDYAYFLYNTGQYESSLPFLKELATVTEPEIELLKTLGEVYTHLQQFRDVISVNEQILAKSAEDKGAIGNMIAAHERLGEFDEAKKWQEKLSKMGGEM